MEGSIWEGQYCQTIIFVAPEEGVEEEVEEEEEEEEEEEDLCTFGIPQSKISMTDLHVLYFTFFEYRMIARWLLVVTDTHSYCFE